MQSSEDGAVMTGPHAPGLGHGADLLARLLAGKGQCLIWRRDDALEITVRRVPLSAADTSLALYILGDDNCVYAAHDNPPATARTEGAA